MSSNPRKGLPSAPRPPGGRLARQTEPPSTNRYRRAEQSHSPPPPPSSSRWARKLPADSEIPETSDTGGNGRSVYSSQRKHSDEFSVSSMSSSGSSLFDRVKVMAGYESSRTSADEDDEPPKPSPQTGVTSLRQRRGIERREVSEENNQPAALGEGYSLWNRVATAAGSLSVNVGMAWSSNIGTYSGEVTPPGQESHLIRVMKAYHLGKARSPSDLPEWLFEEHERRGGSRSRDSNDNGEYGPMEQPAVRSKGLRDVYDAAASGAPVSRRPERVVARNYESGDEAPSKATNRLRALRDAKRNAAGAPSALYSTGETANFRSRSRQNDHQRDQHLATNDERPVARVGLPSGPGGRSRRF